MKKLICVLFLFFLSSCDNAERERQVRNEIDENRSSQSKLDSIKAEFDRLSKAMDSDSVPEYIIDDTHGLIEK
ncbi:hypothetical protein [Fluviicola sp.]|uniref:hypothetical protein n=1 Tax=Fluviicola sp. TaxID=1917219 RepID=UPI0026395838|nr:hypothetical protein [Fluviicola sp.]